MPKRKFRFAITIICLSATIFSCSRMSGHKTNAVTKTESSSKTLSNSRHFEDQSSKNYSELLHSYNSQKKDEIEIKPVIAENAIVSTQKKSGTISKLQLAKHHKEILIRYMATSLASIAPSQSNNSTVDKSISNDSEIGKNQWAMLLMAILSTFLVAGLLPIHRFLLGGKRNTTNGILIIVFGILTLGIVSAIWSFIDIIRIAMGTLKPGNGEYNVKL